MDEHSMLYQIEGPLDSSYSLAIVNRNLAFALEKIYPGRISVSPTASENFAINNPAVDSIPGLRTLLDRGGPEKSSVFSIRNTYPIRTGDQLGKYNMLLFFWEESHIPKEWVESFNKHLHAILAPTHFVRKILIDNGVTIPIHVVGIGLDVDDADGLKPVRAPNDKIRFLHVSSCFARKGPDVLLEAYAKAFRRSDRVSLVIKTFPNPHNDMETRIPELRERFPDMAEIVLINRDLPQDELLGLYHTADAVVLPTRGEGFGLPMAEAMKLGIPVITTAFSGQVDFCHDDNSLLVDYTFAASRSHFYLPHSVWAEPDVDHLAQRMREVYQDLRSGALELDKKVSRAKALVDTQLTWDAVARRIVDFTTQLQAKSAPVAADQRCKVAWVSSYNSRCGIAEYSRFLVQHFPESEFDITVFAKDEPGVLNDGENVVRCWNKKSYDGLVERILAQGAGVAVFQFHLEFFEPEDFGPIVRKLKKAGVAIVVFPHRTKDPEHRANELSLRLIRDELAMCDRILVHQIEDLNNLKGIGLVDNVALFPHGCHLIDEVPRDLVRKQLNLSRYPLIVGMFGFFFEHKGIFEMIQATALLREAVPNVLLLLANAAHPSDGSHHEIARCTQEIIRLGLERNILMVTDFLEEHESLYLLSASDMLILPYRNTAESASGAVRVALSANRPVLCSPNPIFKDLEGVVFTMKGDKPADLAAGVLDVVGDTALYQDTVRRQRKWQETAAWPVMSQRLQGIIRSVLVNNIYS